MRIKVPITPLASQNWNSNPSHSAIKTPHLFGCGVFMLLKGFEHLNATRMSVASEGLTEQHYCFREAKMQANPLTSQAIKFRFLFSQTLLPFSLPLSG